MGNWQPIETAPKDEKTVVLATNGKSVWMEQWPHSSGFNPTHWMPLPTPPENT